MDFIDWLAFTVFSAFVLWIVTAWVGYLWVMKKPKSKVFNHYYDDSEGYNEED